MLCTFCPLTILGKFRRFLETPENLPQSSADKMYRACELKDQTCKKTRTLHFSDKKSPPQPQRFARLWCARVKTRGGAEYASCFNIVRGLLGKGPPNPTLESASPSPFQGSIWHRNMVKPGNRCRIDVESMPNRPLRRGRRGGFEGGVPGGLCLISPSQL